MSDRRAILQESNLNVNVQSNIEFGALTIQFTIVLKSLDVLYQNTSLAGWGGSGLRFTAQYFSK